MPSEFSPLKAGAYLMHKTYCGRCGDSASPDGYLPGAIAAKA